MNNLSELLRPFDHIATKYRVMNVTKAKDKGSVAFYIDARDVMDRLDAVVGAENWSDKYTVLAFSETRWAVECTLIVNGIAKADVGEGDAPKDAYSDALKRAAVKFGIGRYLYDMDTGNWFPIDEWKNFTPEAKKQIDALLRQNLARLGVKPTATNGNGNGHNGNSITSDKPPLWQTWESPAMAKAWAVECGACKNEFEANGSFAKLVTDKFDGKLTKATIADVYAAFYAHQMDKLSKQAESITVAGAQEMVPA